MKQTLVDFPKAEVEYKYDGTDSQVKVNRQAKLKQLLKVYYDNELAEIALSFIDACKEYAEYMEAMERVELLKKAKTVASFFEWDVRDDFAIMP